MKLANVLDLCSGGTGFDRGQCELPSCARRHVLGLRLLLIDFAAALLVAASQALGR